MKAAWKRHAAVLGLFAKVSSKWWKSKWRCPGKCLQFHPAWWEWQKKSSSITLVMDVDPSSRGLRLCNSTFGENFFKLLSAQKILCYALALLKLWQDDSNVSLSGWLLRCHRQSAVKTFRNWILFINLAECDS